MHKLYFFLLCLLVFFHSNPISAQTPTAKRELTTPSGKVRFDQTITNFKMAEILTNEIGKKYVYSPHGEIDKKSKHRVSGFLFATITIKDYKQAKLLLDIETESYENKKQENLQKTDTIVNGLNTYIISFLAVDKNNKKEYVTYAIYWNGKFAIEFLSSDYDNGIYNDKFMKTVQSVEF